MINLFKKTLAVGLIVIFAVFLNGCGGDTERQTTQNFKTHDGGEFTIDVDPSWKIITPSEFYADIPKETVVAFTSSEPYDGFFINININKEKLPEHVSSLDYARANINLSAQNLTDYQKSQEAKVTVNNEPTYIHIFQARLNPTEKLIRFIQLYATKGTNGYIITGGMLPDTPKELREKVGNMVASFKLR